MNKVLMNTSRAFAVACGLGGCVTTQITADAKSKNTVQTEDGCKKIQSGKASWYGREMLKRQKNGKMGYNATSSGAPFSPSANLIAHPTLPFNTKVIVKDEKTGRQISSYVKDRGPFVGGRILDMSAGDAERLGTKSRGIAYVSLYRCP